MSTESLTTLVLKSAVDRDIKLIQRHYLMPKAVTSKVTVKKVMALISDDDKKRVAKIIDGCNTPLSKEQTFAISLITVPYVVTALIAALKKEIARVELRLKQEGVDQLPFFERLEKQEGLDGLKYFLASLTEISAMVIKENQP